MQLEIAFAASSATAVAPCKTRWNGSASAGRVAASTMLAYPAGADVCSGHDGMDGSVRSAKGNGVIAGPVAMNIGMQLARARTGASAVFMSARKAGSGSGNGLKKGVMTHDACMGGHHAARDCVNVNMAGS
jgi:hypothetical protein